MATPGSFLTIRPATTADVPALERLIPDSARQLSRGYYTTEQAEAAIRHVFGVDSQLISDGTYYVVIGGGELVGCGGWSYRQTLYGGDQRPIGASAELDPALDAARIRAFFVAPGFARRGIGRQLLELCADAAAMRGFTRLELMSTLPGIPFYAALGFSEQERVFDTLPDGTVIEFSRMDRAMPAAEGA